MAHSSTKINAAIPFSHHLILLFKGISPMYDSLGSLISGFLFLVSCFWFLGSYVSLSACTGILRFAQNDEWTSVLVS